MQTPQKSTPFNCKGRTTTGQHYDSISAMWQSELSHIPQINVDINNTWYQKSQTYWQHQHASIQGMLGGLGELDHPDVAASRRFLHQLFAKTPLPPCPIALDVGAGIGRVTKHLLLPLFHTVDMLEQNLYYLQQSHTFIPSELPGGTVGKRIACGMQNFLATGVLGADQILTGSLEGRYNLIWIQWCIIYLTDDDLITFLRQCAKCLAPGGFLCLKDNVAKTGFLVDKEDSSIMRSNRYLKHLFHAADLQLVRETKQLDFPSDVFPVRTYALQPIDKTSPISPEANLSSSPHNSPTYDSSM